MNINFCAFGVAFLMAMFMTTNINMDDFKHLSYLRYEIGLDEDILRLIKKAEKTAHSTSISYNKFIKSKRIYGQGLALSNERFNRLDKIIEEAKRIGKIPWCICEWHEMAAATILGYECETREETFKRRGIKCMT